MQYRFLGFSKILWKLQPEKKLLARNRYNHLISPCSYKIKFFCMCMCYVFSMYACIKLNTTHLFSSVHLKPHMLQTIWLDGPQNSQHSTVSHLKLLLMFTVLITYEFSLFIRIITCSYYIKLLYTWCFFMPQYFKSSDITSLVAVICNIPLKLFDNASLYSAVGA